MAKDFSGAMVQAELIPETAAPGGKLDYQAIGNKLEAIRTELEKGNVTVHIIGFTKVVDEATVGDGTTPVEFSVCPSLLLVLPLLRLALNVAATRLILMHGHEGVEAAGHVIMAFGQFVVGGNFVVGIVVFLVLIAIHFLVINHGAVRISEEAGKAYRLHPVQAAASAADARVRTGARFETGSGRFTVPARSTVVVVTR